MPLIKYFIILTPIIVLTVSCKTALPQFGQSIVDNPIDTTISKQAFSKIRALDNTSFDTATFLSKGQIPLNYRLHNVGNKYQKDKKYPLIVVFHGSGAIGSDNVSQLGILSKLFASPNIQNKYPAYILAPQFSMRSSDYILDDNRNVQVSKARTYLQSALQLIDSLQQNLNIDRKRIYAIGFSMGGSTVINALSARPDLFAAGISISGIPQFDRIHHLSTIPIWLIHGMEDTENPINSDEEFYKEMNTIGKVRFWKLKGVSHDNVFSSLLLGENLPKWLFEQHRN